MISTFAEYMDKYGEHIIKYTENWYNLIDSRVTTAIKESDRLRKELEHYENKVNRLYFDKQRVAKGGIGSDAYMLVYSKLERNEVKLSKAQEDYNAFSSMTIALVEEVTKACWKDLFPVMLKLMQFDAVRATEEKRLLRNLEFVSESIVKNIQRKYNLNTEKRINELKSFEKKYMNLHKQKSTSISLSHTGTASSSSASSGRLYKDIRVYNSTGDSPEIEIDLSQVEETANKSSTKSFTGRSRDQNVRAPSLMDKLIVFTSSHSSFLSTDDDTENFPLTPIN